MFNRRKFIIKSTLASAGVSLTPVSMGKTFSPGITAGRRVGIIGLDTSHSIAFTKALNAPDAGNTFNGYKVVAAFAQGSLDIQSSVERIEGYTSQMREMDIVIDNRFDS